MLFERDVKGLIVTLLNMINTVKIKMSAKINYPITFYQTDLQRYVYTNKNVISKLAQQLKSLENVATACKRGICKGLAHTFIAYENQGLGADYISLLKLSKDSQTSINSQHQAIQKYINQVNTEYHLNSENILSGLCTDIFNLQINQYQHNYYYNMANSVYRFELPPRPEKITHFDYILLCLEEYKNDRNANQPFPYLIDFKIEKELIKNFYAKIELNKEIPDPCNNKEMSHIYNKIRGQKSLTADEIHVFIEMAYNYCGLHYASETASFNVNLGISHHNDQPGFSVGNIRHHKDPVTLEDLKYYITGYSSQKKDFSLIFSTTYHAMAIVGRYDSLKECYIFSFFEPYGGLIQTESKDKFFDILTKIPTTDNSKRIFNPLVIGEVQRFEKAKMLSKKPHLPIIIDKNYLIKKHLVDNNTVINLSKNVKLSFEKYYQKNNELTLKLQLGNRIFTIYSELNDTNQTIDLINNSMQEFPSYMGNDIYIDWKGQILNRLSKH